MTFLQILMEEHRGFKAMLDVTDAACRRIDAGADVPLPMLRDVVDFFEHFTDRHHDKEEEVLFPLLARHGIGLDQTVVRALLSQHDAGRMYCRKMEADLARLVAGDRSARADLTDHARGYVELIREHIRIEDEYFYRLADQLLTHAEQEKIIAEFGGAAGPRPQSSDRERYMEMIDRYAAVVSGWQA
ncbi:MAG: hemerythrin domain-containing protein [Acidobacteria bacterium]|nr:hemerythrin domain-containing protein [Acidobacteriota bacterium]